MYPYRLFRRHTVKHGWNEGEEEGGGKFLIPSSPFPPPPPSCPPGVCEGSEKFALFWTVRSPTLWQAIKPLI